MSDGSLFPETVGGTPETEQIIKADYNSIVIAYHIDENDETKNEVKAIIF